MNKTPYILAILFAVGISVLLPSAHAATVVTHWAAPAYGVTTVHTTGPYWGIHPAPCCYTGVVAAGSAPASIAVVTVVPPPARVVYAAPVVPVYPPARPIYAPAAYYYVP